jgi:NAD dependent epimerase/dehydratase
MSATCPVTADQHSERKNVGKKVLVTGADGFIGSHLTEMLVAQGHEVTALSQYNSFNYWGWLEDIECLADVKVVSGDIRDPNFCREIVRGQEVVFHLAALIAIPYSYVAPDSYVDVNVRGTLNICQAARDHGVSRVVHTSTSEVYGTALYVPIDEKHPLQPQSPYSASKIGADAMAHSFFNAFDLPLTILRPFNTYGPRQSARAVIPALVAQIASGQKEIAAGDMAPTRDFNYVEDTCRAFTMIAECDEAIGRTVNAGSNYEISIADTFDLIRRLMGSDARLVMDEARIRPEKSEVFRLWCDNGEIRRLTGFETKYSIEEGLKRTIDWFREPANLAKYKVGLYNV